MSVAHATSKASRFRALQDPETPEEPFQEKMARALAKQLSAYSRSMSFEPLSIAMFPLFVSVLTVSAAILVPMIHM